jgi:hypothetical protein
MIFFFVFKERERGSVVVCHNFLVENKKMVDIPVVQPTEEKPQWSEVGADE